MATATRGCDRRAQLELEPDVVRVPGSDMHYHAVLMMIRDEARAALEVGKK